MVVYWSSVYVGIRMLGSMCLPVTTRRSAVISIKRTKRLHLSGEITRATLPRSDLIESIFTADQDDSWGK